MGIAHRRVNRYGPREQAAEAGHPKEGIAAAYFRKGSGLYAKESANLRVPPEAVNVEKLRP